MSEPIYLTSDGVPFRLGMTLYRYFPGREGINSYPTSDTTHHLYVFEHYGEMIACLCHIGTNCGIDIRIYSTTPSGAVASRVKELQREIKARKVEIQELTALAENTEARNTTGTAP